MQVRGFINLQCVYADGHLYVLEANLRASRTVPFVSKALGVPLVQIATRVMLGDTLADLGFPGVHRIPAPPRVAVKAPVFSHEKLTGAEGALGPEMKSTGEVMGIDPVLAGALYKALVAAGIVIRTQSVLASIATRDKPRAVPVLRAFAQLGFRIFATPETASVLREAGVPVEQVDEADGALLEQVGLVINTPTRGRDPSRAGFKLRRAAFERRIPCLTSLDTAQILGDVLAAYPGAAPTALPISGPAPL